MRNNKILFIGFFALLMMVGVGFFDFVSAQMNSGLGIPRVDILGSKNLTVFDLDEVGNPIQGTGRMVVKYAYRSNSQIIDESNEVVGRRTKNSRTFFLGNKDGKATYKTEFISGSPQYYKDKDGKWWQVEYATTTPEMFNSQAYGVKDRILSLLGVEKAWATESTFYPDADAESTSVDGSAIRLNVNGETWSASRNGDGTNSNDYNSTLQLFMQTQYDSQFERLDRVFLLFDTSSLPDNDVIDSADLSLYVTNIYEAFPEDIYVNLTQSSPYYNTSIISNDYQTAISYSEKLSTNKKVSDFNTASYNNFSLNSTGLQNISKTSVSKFGLRFDNDISDFAPTIDTTEHSANLVCYSADQTGTSYDPKLIIIHSEPEPPVISGVQPTNITNTSSVITWTTDKSADSKVIYGTTTPVESSSPLYQEYDSNSVTSHSMPLSLLNSATTYYYKVISESDDTAVATSSQYSFTTLQNPVTYAYKPQDQATTSQSTLFVDDDLSVTLDANTTYIITAAITASSTAIQPDIKTSFKTPPGSTMAITFGSFDGSTKVAGSGLFASDNDQVYIDLPSDGVVVMHINGSVTTGSTAGTVEFEWSQNTSSATAIKLFKGSYLRAEKIE